jgi:hypothetical protein
VNVGARPSARLGSPIGGLLSGYVIPSNVAIMVHPLDDAWAKFHRADEHRAALKAEIKRLLEAEVRPPIDIGLHYEPQTSSYLVVIARVVDLRHIGLIFGDALQNYRAALDYLVCRLLLSKGAPITTQTAWPVAKDAAAWESAKGKQLAGVDPAYVEIIERYQPKEAGDEADIHPFATLAALSNKDKHQLLTPAPVNMDRVRMQPTNLLHCAVERMEPLLKRPGPLEPGTQLARVFLVTPLEPEHAVNVQMEASLYPALEDGRGLADVLDQIRARVINVLSEFHRIA